MAPIQLLIQPTLEICFLSFVFVFFYCFAGKILTYSASLPVFCFSSWGHSFSGVTLHSESVSGLIKAEGSGGLLPGSRLLLCDPIFPLYLTNPETLQLVYFITI